MTASAIGDAELAQNSADAAVNLMAELQAQDPSNKNWRINLLRSQANQLAIKTLVHTGRQSHMEQWRALDERWKEVELDNQGHQIPAILVERYQTDVGLAKELAADGRLADALSALDKVMIVLSGELNQSVDMRVLAAYVDVGQATLGILPSTELYRSMRLSLCADLVRQIEKLPQTIGVHQNITAAWIEAQSCLGRGQRADVLKASTQISLRQRN